MSPNRPSSVAAVLSPTPATPGSPSEASPRRVAKSAYWRASTPYFSRTTSLVDPLVLADAAGDVEHPHLALVVDELEQVAVAGDDVDRHAGDCVASVPITSSAS